MKTSKPNLSLEQKSAVAQFLLANTIDGVPIRGKMKQATIEFGLSRRTVTHIWTAAKAQMERGKAITFRPTVYTIHKDRQEMDIEKMKKLACKSRTTYRRIATEMKVSKSLVHLWVKNGLLKPHTNAIKPVLTAQNRLCRLKFSLSSLIYDRVKNIIEFKSMHNTIHIDEKWFYITKESDSYYLLSGEVESYRACKSKRYITKLMFMCAVARPRYASSGECTFDGKIGIFPFTTCEAAKRNNKNRLKGTLETKPIDSITKQVIKDCLIKEIVPKIKRVWPSNASKNIVIQQDNAKPHLSDNDSDFRAVARVDGFNIQLVCQPPNSPDTNINDLGFFRAIQSLQDETSSNNCDDLVKNVHNAFDSLTYITFNKVFLSLQGCLVEMMKSKGDNAYKLPHMNKDMMLREGNLPENLQVGQELVNECIQYLREIGEDTSTPCDVDTLVAELGLSDL